MSNLKAEKTQKTKELILQNARLMFDENGYAETTIRAIATASERSTGSVFANWKTKRDLFFEVFGYWPLDGSFAVMAADIIKEAADGTDVESGALYLWEKMTDRGYFEKVPV